MNQRNGYLGKDFDPNRPGNPFRSLSEAELALLHNPPRVPEKIAHSLIPDSLW